MNATELEARFAARNLRGAGILILAPSDALALVALAQQERLPILGIDGFHLRENSTQPDIGESIDFSIPSHSVVGAWTEADNFIRTHAVNVDGFEVVVGKSMSSGFLGHLSALFRRCFFTP
jgi:hypothetical protein